MTPRKVRPNQVFQVFATILRLEFGTINVRVSIIKDKTEFAETVIQFDQPGSRMMQMVVCILNMIQIVIVMSYCNFQSC